MPEQPRLRRSSVALAVGVGAAVGALAWLLGLDPAHALAGAATAAATGLALAVLGPVPDPGWPEPPDAGTARGWHGVPLTSRALEQLDAEPDRTPRLLLPRLRAVLLPALAARGVAPGSPAARALVGSELHDRLGARTWPDDAPSATALVEQVVDRLDELGRGGP